MNIYFLTMELWDYYMNAEILLLQFVTVIYHILNYTQTNDLHIPTTISC